MPNDKKTPGTRRIDLSACKLLSTYGLILGNTTNVEIGDTPRPGIIKAGVTKSGLTKRGLAKRRQS